MRVEERKCDFYLVMNGDGRNKTATRLYDNNAKMKEYCINSSCPFGGGIPDGERAYAVNNKTLIPFKCWLEMLKED